MGKGSGTCLRSALFLDVSEACLEATPQWHHQPMPNDGIAMMDALVEAEEDPDTWLKNSGEEIANPESFRQVFEDFQHEQTGIRSKVHATDPNSWGGEPSPNPYWLNGHLTARSSFYLEGELVGTGIVSLHRHLNGDLEARICTVELRPSPEGENNWNPGETKPAYGQGFGKAWEEHISQKFKEKGVKRVSLSATGLGVHAWASMGYELDPRGGATIQNKKDRLEHYLKTHKDSFSPKLHRQAQALLRRSDTSLHDLTSLGKEEAWEGYNDRTEWAGLNGVREWKGVKEL